MPDLAGVPIPAPGLPWVHARMGARTGTGEIWDTAEVLNLWDVLQPVRGASMSPPWGLGCSRAGETLAAGLRVSFSSSFIIAISRHGLFFFPPGYF